MAVIETGKNPTLLDLSKLRNPDGSAAKVVEALSQSKALLRFLTFMEANDRLGHRSTIRAGLPEGTWRKLYQGVQPSSGTLVQVTDTLGELVSYSEIDASLIELEDNAEAYMEREAYAHLEGMARQVEMALFYGTETATPEQITGLTPRYNSLTAGNARNVIAAGGSGTDNTSIWMISSSEMSISGLVPRGAATGTSAGEEGHGVVRVTPKGQDSVQTGVGAAQGRFEAYVTHYVARLGLAVRDWRAAVRICNIDKSDLSPDGATGADLPNLMFEAMAKGYGYNNVPTGRTFWAMSADTLTTFQQQLSNKTKDSSLTVGDVGGYKTFMYMNTPIVISDVLESDEALVT